MTQDLPNSDRVQIARALERERMAILDLEPKAAMERILDAPEPAAWFIPFPGKTCTC